MIQNKWVKLLSLVFIFLILSGVCYYWLTTRELTHPSPQEQPTKAFTHIHSVPLTQLENITPQITIQDLQVQDVQRQKDQQQVAEDAPEVQTLKQLYHDFHTASSQEKDWGILISMGDIYRKGAFPRFLPNEYLALRIFKVAAMCPDGDVAGLAQVKYIETRDDPISDEDRKGEQLPEEYGIQLCEEATITIQTSPFSSFQVPKSQKMTKKKNTAPQPIEPIYDDFGDFGFAFGDYHFVPHDGTQQNNTEEIPVPRTIFSDSQNVHDHSVMKIAKQNIQSLLNDDSQTAKASDIYNIITEIKTSIMTNKELSQKNIADSIHVLDNLTSNTHSTFETSERDVLAQVWNKIKDEKDSTKRENLKETLAKQLASGVEHGHVVCSTGKITRMLGTFDGAEVDGIETTKPIWAIKEELASKANKIRDDHLKELSERQRREYEQGGMPSLETKMKEEFITQASKEYIDNLNLSPTIVQPLIDMYVEGF